MSENKFGQVGWNEELPSMGNDFMNLELGENNIRVFTNPYQLVVHWYKDNTGSNRKIKCSIEDCPLCKKGVKASYRWLIGIISRENDNQPKILEISSQIYVAIKNLVNNKKWGDVKMYDLTIKRNPPKSNPLYSVSPDPNKGPLSAEEKTLVKAFMERVDFSKFIKPSTPEEIAEKLGVSSSGFSGKGSQEVSRPVISESDFNFGDDT